ncbi:Transcription factor, fungi [Penicillium expansum]|uniref:Transcription factor, fungi n=1 Tax=Penicillium expansum TaxID=27334 RepID=A0A0A2IPM4_PENEN|nr:Transcription factor, fungi [Penicillium expansum]KGO45004.1 Transcription factor, fungi [Penicillium expansum]KGO47099.1 Transcription factor, fungi [Penicillium expansum]KGO60296.1 Transcription factor, fungi [Penicillium expansum]
MDGNASNVYEDTVRRKKKHDRGGNIHELEQRIQSLQEELNEAHASKRRRLPSDEDTGPEHVQPSEASDSELPSPKNDTTQASFEAEADGDGGSYTLKTPKGAMRFFGASSHFSIVSPEGAGWLESKTGNNVWRHAVQRNSSRWRLADWYPRALQDDFQSRCSQPLPSKAVILDLVHEYFDTFNKALPLFGPESFMGMVSRHFSWNPNESPSWWAAFNIVLAFAYMRRAESSSASSDDWQKCLGHVKNVMNVVTELFMRTCDLLAVQALLGLAIFFQGTPNPQPLFMFAAAAVRLSQSIGLHKSNSFGLPESQIEERKRVFWIAFILDADICQRTGRPAAQDTRDYNTLLPHENPPDGLGVMEIGNTKINFFSALARFALIQRKVCDELYSTEAFNKTKEQLMKDVRDCFGDLETWERSIPPNLRPRRNFSIGHHAFLPHILRLHFAYHCCYLNIHRVCLLPRCWPASPQNEGLNPPGLSNDREISMQQSIEAARAAIELISQVRDRYGQSFEWSIVYFPGAALVALFSQILIDPSRPDTESDIAMIHGVVSFLSKVASQEQDTYLDYVLALCSDFESAARKELHRARNPEPESVGDNQPVAIRPQGQTWAQNDYLPPNSFPAVFNPTQPTENDGSNIMSTDQGFYTTGPLSLPAPLSWNWQDMLAGVPPAYDFGAYDLTENTGEL